MRSSFPRHAESLLEVEFKYHPIHPFSCDDQDISRVEPSSPPAYRRTFASL